MFWKLLTAFECKTKMFLICSRFVRRKGRRRRMEKEEDGERGEEEAVRWANHFLFGKIWSDRWPAIKFDNKGLILIDGCSLCRFASQTSLSPFSYLDRRSLEVKGLHFWRLSHPWLRRTARVWSLCQSANVASLYLFWESDVTAFNNEQTRARAYDE